jgi:hypothetical protein
MLSCFSISPRLRLFPDYLIPITRQTDAASTKVSPEAPLLSGGTNLTQEIASEYDEPESSPQ